MISEKTWFNNAITVMNRVAANKYLNAIRNGFIAIMPVTLIGSVFSIIVNLPIPAWNALIEPYRAVLAIPANLTMGFLALYASIGIAGSLAEIYKLDRTSAIVISVLAYLVANTTINAETWSISVGDFGALGLFTSIVTSIFSVEVIRFFINHKLVIKMPKGVPESIINSFMMIVPGLVVVVVLWLIKGVFGFNINAFLQFILTPIKFLGASNSIVSVIFTIFVVCAFWFVGIHGSAAIVGPLLRSFWLANLAANTAASINGEPIPNVLTEPFFQWFVWIGGAGTTLSLALLMVFASRSQFCRSLGRMSVVPGIFNINEPILFGAPIVMNPLFLVPFIGAPLVCGIITYIVVGKLHLIGYAISVVPWTLPAPIGAFLSTTSWMAIPLALINIVVAGLIYFPFFKVFDRQMLEQESQ